MNLHPLVFLVGKRLKKFNGSGRIISRPHGPTKKTQNAAFWKGNGTPAISGKSRLVKYYFIWRDGWMFWLCVFSTLFLVDDVS